jgi:hypothetical protein
MADELIRYNRIKSFIFKPQSYLSFGQVKYNLRDNEIIVLQDMLNQEFFDNFIPADINKYAKYNTYDNAEPIISQKYNNEHAYTYELDEGINTTKIIDCKRSEPKSITNSKYWQKCFPINFKEVEYSSSPFCPLYLITDLAKEFSNKDISIAQIKADLIHEYNRLTDNFSNIDRVQKIYAILKNEFQPYFTKNSISNGMTIEQMINLDDFNAGNFDLWILLNKYKIPSIMISKNEFNNKKRDVMVCWRPENSSVYAIIFTPIFYKKEAGNFNKYKIIKDGNNHIKINIAELKDPDNKCVSNINAAIQEYDTIERYLDTFDISRIINKNVINTVLKSELKIRRNVELLEPEQLVDVVPEKLVDVVPEKLVDVVPEKLVDVVPVIKEKKKKETKTLREGVKNKVTKKNKTVIFNEINI